MPKPKPQTAAKFEAEWEQRYHSFTKQILGVIYNWNTRKPPMGVPSRVRAKIARNESLPLSELKAVLNAAFCSTNHLKEGK